MVFYETLSQLTFATFDLIALEILLSIIFIVQNGQIKFTIDWLLGASTFRKTAYYVYPVIFLGVVYFYASNFFQDYFTNYLVSTGWKTIPSLILSLSFANFWLTKVTLGRKWDFPLVWGSIIVFIISVIILLL